MFLRKTGQVDFIVAGLGNPGKDFSGTRHNTGFAALDYVAKKAGVEVQKKEFNALYGIWEFGGKKIMLLKPQTYMNLSGDSVGRAASYYNVPPEKVIVIFDDVSLPAGRMRIRLKGSAGGHNGIKSIISHIGDNFPRIKLGVGERPDPSSDLARWVLSVPGKEEQRLITGNFDNVFRSLKLLFEGRADEAMNLYNR